MIQIIKDSSFRLFTLLLVTIEIALTYDLRDSYACASFHRDELNITTYSTNSPDPSYYRFLLVDQKDNRLIVGSMNNVTILQLDNISNVKQIIDLKPEKERLDYCKFQKPEVPNCQNHITFITKTREDVPEFFLCGTNAQTPKGYKLTNGVDGVQLTPDGHAACSEDPFSNLTAIFISQGNPDNKELMYYGGYSYGQVTVYRRIPEPDSTVTKYMKGVFSSKWMKNAQFAGSFDAHDTVLFFFREYSVETELIETRLYSRVAKVCKKDVGGDSLLREKWTTYQKARLNCSLPGAFPTYFDAVQQVVSVDENTYYGLFTTNMNGLPASAICAFEKSEIERVFNGPFKQQSSDMSFWTEAKPSSVPTPRPGMCSNDSMKTPDQVLGFIVDHPLMHWIVQPKYGTPIFHLPGEELQRMDIDVVGNSLVFLAGSNRGKVYKISAKDDGTKYKSHLAAVYHPFEKTDVIWSLRHHGKFVYLGTDTSVTQVPVQSDCVNHQSVDSCVYDPYCFWDNTKDVCEHNDYKPSTGYTDIDNFYPEAMDSLNEFNYKNGRNVTKADYGTFKMTLINKYICALGRSVVWKKRPNGGASFTKVKIDSNHFLDSKNSLIISNLTLDDTGVYEAYDEDNPNLIVARYDLQVVTETNIKKIYKAKFDEWCDYFDTGKRIQDNYQSKCGMHGKQ